MRSHRKVYIGKWQGPPLRERPLCLLGRQWDAMRWSGGSLGRTGLPLPYRSSARGTFASHRTMVISGNVFWWSQPGERSAPGTCGGEATDAATHSERTGQHCSIENYGPNGAKAERPCFTPCRSALWLRNCTIEATEKTSYVSSKVCVFMRSKEANYGKKTSE